jgi:hypothetical protein
MIERYLAHVRCAGGSFTCTPLRLLDSKQRRLPQMRTQDPALRKVVGIGSTQHFSLQNHTFEIELPPNFPRSVSQQADGFP